MNSAKPRRPAAAGARVPAGGIWRRAVDTLAIGLATAFLLAPLAAACGLAVDDAERLARAERFHAQGNYQAEIIELKNVTKDYGQGDIKVRALRGVDLDITAGDYDSILEVCDELATQLQTVDGVKGQDHTVAFIDPHHV